MNCVTLERAPRSGLRPAQRPRGTRQPGAALRRLERARRGLVDGLLLLAACLAPLHGHAQAPAAWPANQVNPKAANGDVLLPMPCGGSMAFRRVNIPSADALDDRRVQLGGTEAKFAYAEGTRTDYVGGGFTDPQTKNQRYYLIGKYEVTRLQYDAVTAGAADATGKPACPAVGGEGQLPRTSLTWNEAVQFSSRYADWLIRNALAKLPSEEGTPGFVRLPSEAEWEFAARGGVTVAEAVFEQPAFPMPEGAQRYAWYAGTESSNNELNAIGLLMPNPLGLHDMLGNAGEFVLDPFRLNKHSRLHGQAGGYMVKGGDYRTALADLRSAARTEYVPVDRNGERRDKGVGLRLVVVPGSLPTPARLQAVRKLWDQLATSPPVGAQPLADPVKEVEALASATSDPALKARIQGVGAVIKANIQTRNEQRERSARSEIRVGAYLARKIVEDRVKIRRLEEALKILPENLRKDTQENLVVSRASLESTLNYMIDTTKQIGLDFPGPVTTTQGELLKREFEARSVSGYGPLVDLVVKSSQEARGGKVIDRNALQSELGALEDKVLKP